MGDAEMSPSVVAVTENLTEESTSNSTGSNPVTLLSLNEDAFYKILFQLSFDEVARLRPVTFSFKDFTLLHHLNLFCRFVSSSMKYVKRF